MLTVTFRTEQAWSKLPSVLPTQVGVAFTPLPTHVTLTATHPAATYVAVYHTSLEEEGPGATGLRDDKLARLTEHDVAVLGNVSADELNNTHAAAWADV